VIDLKPCFNVYQHRDSNLSNAYAEAGLSASPQRSIPSLLILILIWSDDYGQDVQSATYPDTISLVICIPS